MFHRLYNQRLPPHAEMWDLLQARDMVLTCHCKITTDGWPASVSCKIWDLAGRHNTCRYLVIVEYSESMIWSLGSANAILIWLLNQHCKTTSIQKCEWCSDEGGYPTSQVPTILLCYHSKASRETLRDAILIDTGLGLEHNPTHEVALELQHIKIKIDIFFTMHIVLQTGLPAI